ncbi:hypothetical protein GN958_ATG17079, partial [Phytophthora infestans]
KFDWCDALAPLTRNRQSASSDPSLMQETFIREEDEDDNVEREGNAGEETESAAEQANHNNRQKMLWSGGDIDMAASERGGIPVMPMRLKRVVTRCPGRTTLIINFSVT